VQLEDITPRYVQRTIGSFNLSGSNKCGYRTSRIGKTVRRSQWKAIAPGLASYQNLLLQPRMQTAHHGYLHRLDDPRRSAR